MAKLLKLRRGTTTQHGSFTGAEGEVTVDTDKETLVVHDGSTAGGHPVAAEDMANVSSASIAGRLANDSIATSKIAAGALPSDVTIASANIVNGTIAEGDIANGAVTAAKIASQTITADRIAASAVNTSELADDAVTAAKLASNAVVNASVDASAAIAGTKISPDFGSQNITTTGSATISGELIVNGNTTAKIHLQDSNHNPDYEISNADGVLRVRDTTNAANRIMVNTDGHIDLKSNVDCESGLDVTGNITVSGTVDGRDVATDGTKLDGIEASATADQTAAEIRTLVESASDSNVFTDADHTKLNGIEASATADQTAAEIRTLVESASDSNVFTDADHSKLNGIEASATADQTASEIVSLINGQNITPANLEVGTGRIGNDSNDYFTFTNNTRCDLYINGSNEFRFESDGDFHADGDVIAQSTTISSDAKLKEDIELVPDALGKLNKLNGVTFKWKRSNEKSAGVIAQDVQKVLPEAVKEVTAVSNGETHLSVNYHALTSILIEAVKELQAEVEKLKGGK